MPDESRIRGEAPVSPARSTRHWVGKSFWTILDQGLFAGSNFILNVLLARQLSMEDYGGFAVAFSLFLFVGTLHVGFLGEPLLVFADRPGRSDFQRYASYVVSRHWRMTLTASVILFGVGLAVLMAGSNAIGVAVLSIAPVVPLLLLRWLVRSMCYVKLRPRLASIAGVGYALFVLPGAAILTSFGGLSVPAAAALMGFGSLGASLFLAHRLGVKLTIFSHAISEDAEREHRTFGRLAVGTNVLNWTSENLYYLVLPFMVGLEGTAALRALWNLLLPVHHGASALGPVFLRALVRDGAPLTIRPVLIRVGGLALLAGGSYALFLGIGHELFVDLLYGGKYTEFTASLLTLAPMALSICLLHVVGTALRATGRMKYVFWATVCGAAMLVAALVLVSRMGVQGAAFGLVLASYTNVLAMAVLLALTSRKRPLQVSARVDQITDSL